MTRRGSLSVAASMALLLAALAAPTTGVPSLLAAFAPAPTTAFAPAPTTAFAPTPLAAPMPARAPALLSAPMPGAPTSATTAVTPAGPPPLPPVQAVTSLGVVAQNPLVQGRDGTFSAAISGTSYWLFDDTTLTRTNAEGANFFSNSLAWTTNLSATNGITLDHDYLDSSGAPTEFMPFLPWEYHYNQTHNANHCTATPCGVNLAIWPSVLAPDPARKRALIFYTEVWRLPSQPGWTTLGTGIAVLTATGTITRPIENPAGPYPTLMWPASENGFGGGAVVVTNTLYMLGCVAGFLVQNCQLGRVPLAGALDKAQWSYFTYAHTTGFLAQDLPVTRVVFGPEPASRQRRQASNQESGARSQ